MSETKDDLIDVPKPKPWRGGNSRLIRGAGAPISKEDRLRIMSDSDFENFVCQWAHYLKEKYDTVQLHRGSGDKGRDVVAWLEPKKTSNRKWDNYQCKHLAAPLQPTDVYVELAKLCYYTYIREFSIPQRYYFVCNSGVGPKLAGLFEKPEKLASELTSNWNKHCRDKITKTSKVELEGDLATWVSEFDFSIIDWIAPQRLIEEHSKTPYHSAYFGSQLEPRPNPLLPPTQPADSETRYVEQLYEAYADHSKTKITKVAEITDPEISDHFHEARKCFYSAESLKLFARDQLTEGEAGFDELCSQFLSGIDPVLKLPHKNGYIRCLQATALAGTLQLGYHPLRDDLLTEDRKGICHHLANEDKLHWVKKNATRRKNYQ